MELGTLESRRAFRVAMVVSTAALVVAVLAPRFVPFTDAPEHAAVMATLRHWGDPAFSGAYRLEALRSQYLLYHAAGALLTVVVGDAALANKLLVAAVAAAFPLSFAALLRAAGRDERLALFGCLPFYSRALLIGFLPFVASLPVMFYGLALVFRQVSRARSRRRAWGLAALAFALFYVHVSAWVLFVATAGAVVLLATGVEVASRADRSVGRFARASAAGLAWLAPSAIAAGAWLAAGRVTMSGSLANDGEIGHMSLSRSLHALPLWVFDVWRSHGDEVAAVAWWSAFAIVVGVSLRRGLGRMPPLAVALRYVPFLAAVLTFLVMPYRVGAATALSVRLAPAVILFALLPLRLPRRLPSVAVLGTLLVANLVGAGTALAESRRANEEELGDLDALLEHVPPGGKLATLNFDSSTRVAHVMPFLHAGSYHRVRNGGVAAFSFTDVAHWPLQWEPGAEPPRKPVVWWVFAPCVFRNAEDGRYYDAVLVRGDLDPFRDSPPGPVFRPAARSGPYVLYTRDTTSPEWPAWTSPDEGPCVARPAPSASLD